VSIDSFEANCLVCVAFRKRRKSDRNLPCPLRVRGKRWTPADVYAMAPKDWTCAMRVVK